MFNKLHRDNEIWDIVWLALLWAGIVVFVNPNGNFPLNDDFSYGKTVLVLLRDGIYQPTRWPAMTLLTHVLWGALFCIPFGFSFSALRISILFLSLIGIVVTYLIFRSVQASRRIAFFGALLLAFNPIYFALSNTFMTDVTFVSLSLVSILFFIRHLRDDSNTALLLATLFSVLTVMCRQFGLLITIAYGMTYTYCRGFSLRSLFRGWIAFLCGCAAFIIYQYWLHKTGIVPYYHFILQALITHSPAWLLRFGFKNVIHFLLYTGLCLFPIAMLLPLPFLKLRLKRVWSMRILAFSIVALIVFYMIRHRYMMPMVLNIINPGGIGPINLRDIDILYLPNAHQLPIHFWKWVTLISVMGAGWLLGHLGFLCKRLARSVNAASKDYRAAVMIFILGYVMIYIFCMIWTIFVDRYILTLIPLFTLIIFLSLCLSGFDLKTVTKKSLYWTVLLFFFCSLFSVAATRDYLTTNRIRWQMLRHLIEEQHVSPARIDGGVEFNGWYLYDEKTLRLWNGSYIRKRDKSWWWVVDDEYLIAMGPVEGYDVVNRKVFKRWLTWKRQAIYCLHRKACI